MTTMKFTIKRVVLAGVVGVLAIGAALADIHYYRETSSGGFAYVGSVPSSQNLTIVTYLDGSRDKFLN